MVPASLTTLTTTSTLAHYTISTTYRERDGARLDHHRRVLSDGTLPDACPGGGVGLGVGVGVGVGLGVGVVSGVGVGLGVPSRRLLG